MFLSEAPNIVRGVLWYSTDNEMESLSDDVS